MRTVIFALVVDRKELDQVDESKLLLIQSLRPEPEAVMTATTPRVEKQEQTKRSSQNKKSRVRVVDLESPSDVVYGQVETAATPTLNTMAISIPEGGTGQPPFLLLHQVGSSPSAHSVDSQDVNISMVSDVSSANGKHSTFNVPEMRQMLLDLTEKKNKLEEAKAALQLQLHGVQLENQDLSDRVKTMEQQNTEFAR